MEPTGAAGGDRATFEKSAGAKNKAMVDGGGIFHDRCGGHPDSQVIQNKPNDCIC